MVTPHEERLFVTGSIMPNLATAAHRDRVQPLPRNPSRHREGCNLHARVSLSNFVQFVQHFQSLPIQVLQLVVLLASVAPFRGFPEMLLPLSVCHTRHAFELDAQLGDVRRLHWQVWPPERCRNQQTRIRATSFRATHSHVVSSASVGLLKSLGSRDGP